MLKKLSKVAIVIICLVIILVFSVLYLVVKNYQLERRLTGYNTSLSSINNQLKKLEDGQASNTETVHRLSLAVASKQTQLTDTVARAATSVVSVVISKDVPQYAVTYVNPFGDDPMFQGFGIQIPVYTQKGVTNQEIGAGSGFFVGSSGYIITNKHVVFDDTAQYTVLLPKGVQKTATVVYKDPNNDMAIIKIAGSGYPVLPLGNSDALVAGQSVVAIGNALGQFNNSVSVGIVSGLNRTIQATQDDGSVETLNNVIQTDAAINPGNSGGPLLDLNGNVVGINVATVSGSNNISFSIPINSLKSVISSNIK